MQRLAVQGPNGRFQLELAASDSVSELKRRIAERTSIVERRQKLIFGFPPKDLAADNRTLIESSGLSNGDMIRVTELSEAELPTRKFERRCCSTAANLVASCFGCG